MNDLFLWIWLFFNSILPSPTQIVDLSTLNKQRVRMNKAVTRCKCVSATSLWSVLMLAALAAAVLVHQLMRLPLSVMAKLAVLHGSPSAILISSHWGVRVPRDWITDPDPAGHWITLFLTHRCVSASKLSSGSLSLSSAMANKCQEQPWATHSPLRSSTVDV